MKVVLLAGGYGTRISEESHLKPKPMIDIGDKPILLHIMEIYQAYGYSEFVICLGYKGHLIKEYFANYFLYNSDVTFDYRGDEEAIHIHRGVAHPFKVTLVDTGLNTMTAGRLRRVKEYLGDQPFLLTYGDGLADISISDLVTFHHSHGGLMTVSAVKPSGRFGALDILDGNDQVQSFVEKPKGDGSWINAGFFVCEPRVLNYISSDDQMLEQAVMPMIAEEGGLFAFRHEGFWHPMDTIRDKQILENLWATGKAPWLARIIHDPHHLSG